MIAIIEDNIKDYLIASQYLLRDMEHVHFITLQDFLDSSIQFNVVITDLNLPDSYGIETLTKITKETSSSVFVLTATAGDYLTGKHYGSMIDAGALDVFEKSKLLNSDYTNIIKTEIQKCLLEQKLCQEL